VSVYHYTRRGLAETVAVSLINPTGSWYWTVRRMSSEAARILVEYLSVLTLTVLLHEVLHLVAARSLGYKARLRVTRRGFAVVVEGYTCYKHVFDIADLRLRRHYLLISLSPYAVVPVYAMLAFCLESTCIGAAVALKAAIVYHVLNIALELVQ